MSDTVLIEQYCLGVLSPEEKLMVEVRQLTDPAFRSLLQAQSDTYALIRMYGREQLQRQIKEVENELFSAAKYSNFRKTIFSIFSK